MKKKNSETIASLRTGIVATLQRRLWQCYLKKATAKRTEYLTTLNQGSVIYWFILAD
jgi:hypothetical protein